MAFDNVLEHKLHSGQIKSCPSAELGGPLKHALLLPQGTLSFAAEAGGGAQLSPEPHLESPWDGGRRAPHLAVAAHSACGWEVKCADLSMVTMPWEVTAAVCPEPTGTAVYRHVCCVPWVKCIACLYLPEFP
jgi:hypothetical protein